MEVIGAFWFESHSREKFRKVQGFFHHSGGTAVAKAAVEQIQGLSRNDNGPFTLNEPFRFDFKMCLVRPPGLEPRSVP